MSVVEQETGLKFEDLNTYASTSVYTVPNEDYNVWRELLKGIPIYRAAGICSAGEVGLFSLLPLVRQELVLVDHSYMSLMYAMSKYVLLREKGWKQTTNLLQGREFVTALKEAQAKLPETVRTRANWYSSSAETICKEWSRIPERVALKSCRKLDKVTFVHGDMTDLVARGPFGLFYMSNAHEHYDRTGKSPVLDKVLQVVRPGGYVVACGRIPKGWTPLASALSPTHSWTYYLYRVPEAS